MKLALLWVAFPLFGQPSADAVADRMIGLAHGIAWEASYSATRNQSGVDCRPHRLVQTDIYATQQWSYHCATTREGIVRESFFYIFGEPPLAARLRVDLRPEDPSPERNALLLDALRKRLSQRFGSPDHAPELPDIGFAHTRYGQPVAGDHWKDGSVHYFLHSNRHYEAPMGVRQSVQLIVMRDRLMDERARDPFIQQVDGLGSNDASDPIGARLEREFGEPFTRALHSQRNGDAAAPVAGELMALLRQATAATPERRALCLLAADRLVSRLAQFLVDSPPGGEREAAAAGAIRGQLAAYRVTLGGMTHNGGLDYQNDLLLRVWRELPGTEGFELAFVELQRRGWSTGSGESCPPNPDLFRLVIERGEAFLTTHPQTGHRKEVLYTLAVAYESWWSIAHAPADDPFVGAPPYPRRLANAREAAPARERAIQFYREVVRLAPESPEAASAQRRLPRLESGLDTGLRRFFCSYC